MALGVLGSQLAYCSVRLSLSWHRWLLPHKSKYIFTKMQRNRPVPAPKSLGRGPAEATAGYNRRRSTSAFGLPCRGSYVAKFSNSNSNEYNPLWHRSQCCGVKWGARVLRVRSGSRRGLPVTTAKKIVTMAKFTKKLVSPTRTTEPLPVLLVGRGRGQCFYHL